MKSRLHAHRGSLGSQRGELKEVHKYVSISSSLPLPSVMVKNALWRVEGRMPQNYGMMILRRGWDRKTFICEPFKIQTPYQILLDHIFKGTKSCANCKPRKRPDFKQSLLSPPCPNCDIERRNIKYSNEFKYSEVKRYSGHFHFLCGS